MFRTIFRSISFSSIIRTKLRSILMILTGISLRMPMEEKPVPKSSSAISTPLDFRLTTTFLSRSRFSSLQRSVTSKHRCSGG